ncbi:MAG: helix-turn-helix domain-containing protein [Dehalococcoidia bacterium]
MNQSLLTIAEAATTLSIGRTKVYELLQTGELRGVYIGTARRIAVCDLDDYIERLRGDGTVSGSIQLARVH